MTNTQFIIMSIKGSRQIIEGNDCAICGGNQTDIKWYKVSGVISSSFTDYDYLRNKDSAFLCSFCHDCLSGTLLIGESGKHSGIRAFSFYADTKGFKIIRHSDKWDFLVIKKLEPPYYIGFTTTHKKHISFKGKITTGNSVIVNTETGNIVFDRNEWHPICEIVQKLYNEKITKSELLQADATRGKFISEFIKLKPHINKSQYRLIVDCVQQEQE